MQRPLFTLFVAIIIAIPLAAGPVEQLLKVKTIPALARFIYNTAEHRPSSFELLRGLDDPRTVQIKGYDFDIPIREVFGTIVEECFNEELPKEFMELGKGYGVREICSFRTADDEMYRYHICIYEDRQYAMMKVLLQKRSQAVVSQSRHTPRPSKPR